MRKFYLFLFVFTAFITVAKSQSPDLFNYQAYIEDGEGNAIPNTEINLLIEIIANQIDGELIYSETHSIETDINSMISLHVGAGENSSGQFSMIDWNGYKTFIKTSIDLEGGTNYELIGINQLVSVPYALNAKKANTLQTPTILIGNGQDESVLTIKNNNYSRFASYSASNNSDQNAPFVGYKSRGTLSSPTNIQAEDRITGIYGYAYGNGNYFGNAAVELIAGEQSGSNGMSSYIKFGTTNIGSNQRQERMRIAENGNIGIGTENPQYKLDVSGGINATDILIEGTSIQSMIQSNTDLGNQIEINGNGQDIDLITLKNENYSRVASYSISDNAEQNAPFVGYKARGSINTPTNIQAEDRITGIYGYAYGNGNYFGNAAVELIAGEQSGSNGMSSYIKFGTTNIGSIQRQERMRIAENGNIGIGTQSPSSILQVNLPSSGDQKDNGIRLTRGDGYLNMINGTLYNGEFQARIEGQSTHPDSPGIILVGTPSLDEATSKGIILRAGKDQQVQNANVLNVQNYTEDLLVVKNDGRVGLGKVNPSYKLDVSGEINATDILIEGTSIQSMIQSNTDLGNKIEIIGNGQDIDLITVKNENYSRVASYSISDNAEQNAPFVGYKARGSINTPTNIQAEDRITGIYGYAYGNGNYFGNAAVELIAGEQSGSNGMSSYIKFGTTNIGSIQRQERMRIAENGNVGIGTSTPKSKLQVTDGDIYIENASKGVIMTSPNGNCWRMTVDDTGNPVFTSINCPQ